MRRLMLGAGVLAAAATLHAAVTPSQAARLAEAAQVVQGIQASIPGDAWDRAQCVAVVPNLKKAAFIVGGEYGRGVVSCRAGDRWSAPMFVQLAKGSWGFQAGAEEVDVVLLVMNEQGVQSLLQQRATLGADVSIAAGPVGRQSNIGTDVSLNAEMLAYSHARGLFAGIDLSGGVLRPDDDTNVEVYGRRATPRTILATREISAPTEAQAFLTALNSQGLAAERTAATSGAAPSGSQSSRAKRPSTQNATDEDLRAMVVSI